MPRTKTTVTVEDRTSEALASGVGTLEQASRTKRDAAASAVEEARRELKPTVKEAARLLDLVHALTAKYSQLLNRLTSIDWPAIRMRYRLPEEMISRLHTLAFDARDLLTSAQSNLAEIPRRVQKLTPEDLQKRLYSPRDLDRVLGGAHPRPELHPVGPMSIRATVAAYRTVAETFTERMKEVAYLVEELTRRISESAAEPPRELAALKIEDEDAADEPRPLPPTAEIAFDVFEEAGR